MGGESIARLNLMASPEEDLETIVLDPSTPLRASKPKKRTKKKNIETKKRVESTKNVESTKPPKKNRAQQNRSSTSKKLNWDNVSCTPIASVSKPYPLRSCSVW